MEFWTTISAMRLSVLFLPAFIFLLGLWRLPLFFNDTRRRGHGLEKEEEWDGKKEAVNFGFFSGRLACEHECFFVINRYCLGRRSATTCATRDRAWFFFFSHIVVAAAYVNDVG